MKRVVLITGASTGMGRDAALLFAQRGWVVYAGARRIEKIPTEQGIRALALDVTRAESREGFVRRALEEQGRVDVLINNAGYGEVGSLEETDLDRARSLFETNVFGAAAMAQLVLPSMRTQGSGRIVNVSSVGEDIVTPLGGWYHATKAALRRWSNVLDLEVRSFGVRSVIVQPGATRTEWSGVALAAAEINIPEASPYRNQVHAVRALLGGESGRATATSADLAEVFYRAATELRPRYAYFNSLADRLLARFARVHPRLWTGLVRALVTRLGRPSR